MRARSPGRAAPTSPGYGQTLAKGPGGDAQERETPGPCPASCRTAAPCRTYCRESTAGVSCGVLCPGPSRASLFSAAAPCTRMPTQSTAAPAWLPSYCLTPLTPGTPRTAEAQNARTQDARSAGPYLGRQQVWRSLPLALVSWGCGAVPQSPCFWRRACFLCLRQVA
jgi:hypothetical protein